MISKPAIPMLGTKNVKISVREMPFICSIIETPIIKEKEYKYFIHTFKI